MTIRSLTEGSRPRGDRSQRSVGLATAFSLLLMALLAPFAQFGVLKTLIVPTDPAATTANIAGSLELFQAAIAALVVVAILDVIAAWGFYRLLRPIHMRLALVVGSLRVVYAAAFAIALLNLVDAAQLVNGANETARQSAPLQAQVAAAVASFDSGWSLALAIFGLHLVGLGALLFRLPAPRVLSALVAVAGAGYLADSVGRLLITDYALTIGTFTFVGEALLIVWLFWRAAKGFRPSHADASTPAATSAAVAS